MTLKELLDTITSSSREDWWHEPCWGAHSGPSYRNQFEFCEKYRKSENTLKVNSHSDVAVYKPDISITLAYGLDRMENFQAQWANKFPDSLASSSYVDVFYNNALVYREPYVTVDGGRARLPIPRRKLDEKKEKVIALNVPYSRYYFLRLIDSLDHVSSFDDYFEQAGFKIVDEEWPD